ncbi:MAG: hypothetical protein VYC49_07595 [Pseudomonadota bacterium]|jgi:hypothetical protein|nr:hypothetical protein [bacterium]MEC8879996.1 hypothetical protein [Pseudomonadota bacterium]|tara:strand:- start:3919 stop:4392 length:474 start_codon:yes stop_codon:yes gene_type:complete
MLSKLLDLKRLLLVSPEALCLLIVILFFQRYPGLFEVIAIAVKHSKGLPSFLGGLPLFLVGISYQLGMGILRPGDEDENKVLYEWPYYWAIEFRVYGSIAICALATCATALFYLNPLDWPPEFLGAIFVGAMLVPVVTVVPLLLAKMAIRKILTLHG